jgi:hypothetical protein
MFELGVLVAFVGGGFALVMLWLGSERSRPARPAELHFVRCEECLGEMRAGRTVCPRCGAAQVD